MWQAADIDLAISCEPSDDVILLKNYRNEFDICTATLLTVLD